MAPQVTTTNFDHLVELVRFVVREGHIVAEAAEFIHSNQEM